MLREKENGKINNKKGMAAQNRHALSANKDVIMVGFAGLQGSAVLAREKRPELLARYSPLFVEGAAAMQNVPEAAAAGESGGCEWFPLSEGGVFEGLRNMAETAGVGLEIDLKRIPIKQETVEICNYFDINPYQLLSGGSYLILADNGYRQVYLFQKAGIPAEIIGITTKGNDRVVINGEIKRFLEKHYTDAVYRVLPEYKINALQE